MKLAGAYIHDDTYERLVALAMSNNRTLAGQCRHLFDRALKGDLVVPDGPAAKSVAPGAGPRAGAGTASLVVAATGAEPGAQSHAGAGPVAPPVAAVGAAAAVKALAMEEPRRGRSCGHDGPDCDPAAPCSGACAHGNGSNNGSGDGTALHAAAPTASLLTQHTLPSGDDSACRPTHTRRTPR